MKSLSIDKYINRDTSILQEKSCICFLSVESCDLADDDRPGKLMVGHRLPFTMLRSRYATVHICTYVQHNISS